ncbi:MAG: acyl-CoA thioesterase [Solirubrobacteraceae bacterium]
MAEPFAHRMRVRYVECDALGVVFNAHYLSYMDQTITELFRAGFGGYRRLLDSGLDMAVAEARIRFRSPARFDEEIDLEATVAHIGTTSLITDHRLRRDGELLIEGRLVHIWVQRATTVKTAIPDWARTGLNRWYEPGTDHRG